MSPTKRWHFNNFDIHNTINCDAQFLIILVPLWNLPKYVVDSPLLTMRRIQTTKANVISQALMFQTLGEEEFVEWILATENVDKHNLIKAPEMGFISSFSHQNQMQSSRSLIFNLQSVQSGLETLFV